MNNYLKEVADIRHKKLFYLVFLFLLLFVFMSSGIYAHSFLDAVSLNFEKEIGYLDYRMILARQAVASLSDAELLRVNTVFARLVNQSKRCHELDFKLTVLDNNSVNAFALPGGFIFLNSGALSFVKNDSELAGILGHEIGHVDCRHAIKTISRTTGVSLFLNLVLDNNVSQKKELIQSAAMISLNLIQLGYSRTAEFEADRYGVSLMRKAGYAPEKLLEFWRRIALENENNIQLPGFFDLLSNHPPVIERIKAIEETVVRQKATDNSNTLARGNNGVGAIPESPLANRKRQ